VINPFLKTPIGQHGKHIEIKNLRKSWSKYGSIKLGIEEMSNKWFCQVCQDEQPLGIEPFLFPMSDREYLRICPLCENIKRNNEIVTYESLIIIRRKQNKSDHHSEF